VPRNRRKFSPEFKDEAVKAVIMNSRPIARVAREIAVNEVTLGNGSPLTGVIMLTRSRRSTSTSELDYARPSDWFGNSRWKTNS
jgi:hypothetical protein